MNGKTGANIFKSIHSIHSFIECQFTYQNMIQIE